MLNILLCEDAYDFVLSVIYSLLSKDPDSYALVLCKSTTTPQNISFHRSQNFQDPNILSKIQMRMYNSYTDLMSFLCDFHLLTQMPKLVFIPSIHESVSNQQTTNQLLSVILNISNMTGVDKVYLNYDTRTTARGGNYENYMYFCRFSNSIYLLRNDLQPIKMFKLEWSSEELNVRLIEISSKSGNSRD